MRAQHPQPIRALALSCGHFNFIRAASRSRYTSQQDVRRPGMAADVLESTALQPTATALSSASSTSAHGAPTAMALSAAERAGVEAQVAAARASARRGVTQADHYKLLGLDRRGGSAAVAAAGAGAGLTDDEVRYDVCAALSYCDGNRIFLWGDLRDGGGRDRCGRPNTLASLALPKTRTAWHSAVGPCRAGKRGLGLKLERWM
jgi:hypothetical protein